MYFSFIAAVFLGRRLLFSHTVPISRKIIGYFRCFSHLQFSFCQVKFFRFIFLHIFRPIFLNFSSCKACDFLQIFKICGQIMSVL